MNVSPCAVAIVVMNAALAPLATYGQEGMGTAFTYQGQLRKASRLPRGAVGFRFIPCNTESRCSPIALAGTGTGSLPIQPGARK